VDIKIESPWIVIPFSDSNDEQGECWILRCGDIQVRSGEREELIYNNYQVSLEKCTLKYFTSIQHFRDYSALLDHPRRASLLASGLFAKGKYLKVIE
jgi:hypothetical protein